MPVLSVENVMVKYGKKEVIKNITFSVNKGEIVGLLGRNGCGKTTIIKVLAGLVNPSGGTIFINGTYKPKEACKLIGYCPQENSFFEKLTVKENIEYFGNLHNLERQSLKILIKKTVYLLDLEEKLNEIASRLSGGQKRRLNIACSIVHLPEVLLMDEPSLGLDPVSRQNLWRLIKTVNNAGTTIVLTSNNLEEIYALCDRVIAVQDGKIRFGGSAEMLRDVKMLREIFMGEEGIENI